MMKKYIIGGLVVLAILCGIQIQTSQASCLYGGGGGTGICSTTSTVGYNLYLASTTPSGTPIYGFQANGSGGSASNTIIFYANGQLFITTGTINFAAGSNVTITTSSSGTYTISSSGSGGSSTVNLSGSSTANTFPYWLDTNGDLSSSSPEVYNWDGQGDIGIGSPVSTSSVSTPTTTELFSNGVGLYTPIQAMLPQPTLTVINNLQGLASGVTSTQGTATLLTDATNYIIGTSSLAITTKADASVENALVQIATTSFAGQQLRMWVRISNASDTPEFYVRMSNDNGTDYYYWNILNIFNQDGVYQNNQWIPITLSLGNARTTGSPNWNAINSIIFRIADDGAASTTIWVNGASMYPQESQGVVTFAFDDAFQDQWSVSKPILDQYGYHATYYFQPDNINSTTTPGLFMTFPEVQAMAMTGDEISLHTDLSISTSTPAVQEQMILSQKNWFINNGFSYGSNDFAYASGYVSPSLQQFCQKYFISCRGTGTLAGSGYGYESYPPTNPYLLQAINIISTTATATVEAQLNAVKQNGGWAILLFHHVTTSTASGNTEYASSSFQQLVNYVASNGMQVKTVADVENGGEWSLPFTGTSTQIGFGLKGINAGATSTTNGITDNGGITTPTLTANNIYDNGATSTACLGDPSGLIGSVNCVNTINNLTGTVIATGTAGQTAISSSTGNLVTSLVAPTGTILAMSSSSELEGVTITTSTLTYSKQIFATTTVTAINNTTTLTTVVSTTIPGNTLGNIGQSMRITVYGTFYNNSTSSVGITTKLLYGGSTLTSTGSSNIASSSTVYPFTETILLSNASGTTNNQLGSLYFIGNGVSNTKQFTPTTVDSTQNQSFQIQMNPSLASSTITVTVNSVNIMLDGATTTVVTGISYN